MPEGDKMRKNKNNRVRRYGDGHESVKKRSSVLAAEPIDDPKHIDPKRRVRYFRENLYPYAYRMSYDEYYDHKFPLQVELVKLQNWIREAGERVIILFEGRDAAGKGGTIRRFMEHWNPRGARVVALDKPSDVEMGQWYFQRYIANFPTAGEIVLFDRSWYNRAGVERVLGFSEDSDYRMFMRQAPMLERMIVESGVHLIKLYFSVSRKEQLRRFKKRAKDPLKQWKISPVDILSKDKWAEYTEAKEAMFLLTDIDVAPLDDHQVGRQDAGQGQRDAPHAARVGLRREGHVGGIRARPLHRCLRERDIHGRRPAGCAHVRLIAPNR